jgi:hypothetical protein
LELVAVPQPLLTTQLNRLPESVLCTLLMVLLDVFAPAMGVPFRRQK